MLKTEKKPRKPKNISSRLMRGIVIILLLTVLIPVIAYNVLPEWIYYAVPATRLWLATESISEAYGTDAFLDSVHLVEKTNDASVEIYTADNKFIYSTRALIESLPPELSKAKEIDPEYRNDYPVLYGKLGSAGKDYIIKKFTDGTLNVTFIDCYQFFPSGDRVEVSLQVSQSTTNTKIDLAATFFAIMTVMMAGLTVVSRYIKRFTRPINTMCDITEKMAKLDFSEKCPQTSLSEINMLSDSINEMSSALDDALTDLKEKNKKLEKDIENERTIDNLRQTFVSGISHELKTPIAIIQGYAEGAKLFYESGEKETAGKYCDIIMEESTRMNAMIMKLLEITKYDSGAYALQKENFGVRELIDDWFERNASILEEKGITTENLIPASIIGNGDKIILASVVNNYISNAVSHVDNEKRITAEFRETDTAYRVYIFNTGSPIAEKDIDKIWTSFYRADKSLSRSQGRFGLGLAIVASIQRLHGMEYGVENVENGVRFWFDIAKSEIHNS